jgi:hypothetical protein
VSAPNIYRDSTSGQPLPAVTKRLRIRAAVIEKFSFPWCGRSSVRLRIYDSFQLCCASHPGRFTQEKTTFTRNSFPSCLYINYFEGPDAASNQAVWAWHCGLCRFACFIAA